MAGTSGQVKTGSSVIESSANTTFIRLGNFPSAGFGISMPLAAKPAPVEQTEKKNQAGSKTDEQKQEEKKDATGK